MRARLATPRMQPSCYVAFGQPLLVGSPSVTFTAAALTHLLSHGLLGRTASADGVRASAEAGAAV